MNEELKPRRGGADGVWCLGNNEPDGKNWLATYKDESIGCYTKEEATQVYKILFNLNS
jgi:hypothetical protein